MKHKCLYCEYSTYSYHNFADHLTRFHHHTTLNVYQDHINSAREWIEIAKTMKVVKICGGVINGNTKKIRLNCLKRASEHIARAELYIKSWSDQRNVIGKILNKGVE